ncbi:PAS domain-containing protein [Methanogenium cariaci]|uniref:PAS domain-containing protein n=1 Tax=Methanogenium cariaci TaxID=2197 RepID=UPI001FDF8DCD|nr:PAS domain-containing protein [Methanogenium cariaci]
MLGSPSTEQTAEVNLLETVNLIRVGFADILRDVIENGAEYPETELEYTSVWGGKEVYLRAHVSPILSGGIPPEGARFIIDDITRRKEAETLLKRTQFAFDHSPDEIYFVNKDGLIIYANAHARTVFGIEPDSPPISMTVFDINPLLSRAEWELMWSKLVEEEYYRFESVHRHNDGTPYPVDILKYRIVLTVRNIPAPSPVTSPGVNRPKRLFGESEGRLRTLIQTIPDLVWLKDEKQISRLQCDVREVLRRKGERDSWKDRL